MSSNINFLDWLQEAEQPAAAQAPTSDPNAQIVQQGQQQAQPQPNQTQPPQQTPQEEPEEPQDNVEDDPVSPDADENESPEKDFEQWKHDFFELSIKGDVGEMIDSIGQVKDRPGLDAAQHKFIWDNLQILLYRQDANVSKATKEIRNLIKQDLDRTNPGTTVMQHLMSVLEKEPLLAQVLIKLTGWYGLKGDLHRKWVAAILGAVQVGGGSSREDIIYFDRDYTISISTRFSTQFGEINLGKWSLKADDPQRYLTDPEFDRLQEGSPEEKQTLRRRIIAESIAEKFKQRAYAIHVVSPDGTIHSLGLDLGDSILAAYKEGKIVVRGKENEEKDAMISDTGEIISLVDIDILYVMETGETDSNGKPEMVEVPFMERRDSILYLVADMETLQGATSTLSGMFFRETPYNGNPSDIQTIAKCIPSLSELLNRSCA